MDWLGPLLGFLAGFLPQLPGWLMLSRQRAKLDADTEKTNAETVEMWTGVWESAITARDKEIVRLTRERDLAREGERDKQAQINFLHEQKVHAEAYLTIAQVRLAHYEGRALTDDKDER